MVSSKSVEITAVDNFVDRRVRETWLEFCEAKGSFIDSVLCVIYEVEGLLCGLLRLCFCGHFAVCLMEGGEGLKMRGELQQLDQSVKVERRR